MNKKIILKIASVIFVVLLISACGSGDKSKSDGKKTLKSADVVSETSPYTEGMKYFTETAADKLGGDYSIKHFASGKLGSDQEIVEGVKMGSIDFAITGTVPGSDIADTFYLPYLIKSEEHLDKVIEGDIAEEIKEKFEEEVDGMKLIGMVYYAPRVLTTEGTQAEDLAGLKGLQVRVANDQASIDAWKALGTNPTPIDFTDLYTSLQTGVVDAQENPYEIIANDSFYEVQDTVIETYHSYPVRFFIMNEKLYDSLSEEEQQVIEETWTETAAKIKDIYKEKEEEYKEELVENGMEFVEIDQEELAEATKEVREEYAINAFGEELYEKIIKLGEEE